MTFGEKLQKLRKDNGLSQEQLADKIEVSRQALSKWELGVATPDTENVLHISRIFGVSTDYLLYDEYESEDAVYAARTEKAGNACQSNTRIIVGACLAVVGLLTVIALGILSSLNPSTAITYWGTFRGFIGYLMCYNTGWLFGLSIILIFVGISTIFPSGFLKLKEKFKSRTRL